MSEVNRSGEIGDRLDASSTAVELLERIAIQERQIAEMLGSYDARSAIFAWFDTLRAIEECINLITVEWDDDAFEKRLLSLQMLAVQSNTEEFLGVHGRLVKRFGKNFGIRFAGLMLRGASIAMAFALHGKSDVYVGFKTVGSMMGYLQSRRRHFVGLLHFLPTVCRGTQVVTPLETFAIFLPAIELIAIHMMGAQNSLLVSRARQLLELPPVKTADLAMLDGLFLEPERARIMDMPITDAGQSLLKKSEKLPPNRLFSAAELRNDLLLIQAAYSEFDLASTEFSAAADIIRRLSYKYIDRDFWIVLRPKDLVALENKFNASPSLRSALVNTSSNYMKCLSSYAPLVLVDGEYRSTVTLLSRFIYYWRAQCLERRKRYQIRAGFIFEDAVADELEAQGFHIQNITRINRHEFDVVTVRDGVIWNVQCKNNFTDLARVEADADVFARFNKMLVRSYERALTKENKREHLLKEKLDLEKIQHMVVSRFPVVCENRRIIPFSRISLFADRTKELVSAA